ncbi:MAG TPA: PH domain-containing protein [Vicinamibacterales bacterium]|nr:PH domain-containing protein [Vicinamibacterales bacterium]
MEVFTIAPADTKALWLIGLIPLLVLVLVVGVLGASIAGARTARFEISTEGLRLHGDWYGRFIPANQLVAAGARRVDLANTPDLLPGRRTMGTSFSGYQAGWFRLRNGESALLYLTDRTKAVYVPTTDGYAVLLSPSEPDRFLSALNTLTRR